MLSWRHAEHHIYDTDGKRVRTSVGNNSPETWFIYGMDGELIAEYAQGMTPAVPAKEYGYRNGELLIVAEAPTAYELVVRHTGKCADVVYMWTHDGAHLVQYDCWGGANQHFSIEAVGGGYYKIIAQHSGRALSIENNSSQGGRVVQWSYYGGLNQQWSVEATEGGYVRLIARHSGEVMEIAGGPGATHNGAELIQWTWWGASSQQWQLRGVGNSNTVKWLINDHLGTPRMIADGTGSLAGITRKDYLPFGEELSTQGGRTSTQGYRSDNTRQEFTGKERDDETGLDYFGSRYYASTQGRFTSVDPYNIILEAQATAEINPEKAEAQILAYLMLPQQWNRYAYVVNNPLRYVDPTGEKIELTGSERDREIGFQRIKEMVGEEAAKLLYVREENGHYYVDYHGKPGDGDRLAATGEFGVFIANIIDHAKTTEFRVGTSFSTKNGNSTVAAFGGAATVGAEESLSGNTQIFVHPNAGNITTEKFGATMLGRSKSSNGRQLDFYNDIDDAHEFGHAYGNMVEGQPIKNSDATNRRAVQLENYIRQRRGLNTRTQH